MRIKQTRDSYYDNVKFILISLVVLGHFISPLKQDNNLLNTIYNFIYTFHMPAFILISGYFSKGCFKKGYAAKTFKNILVPYFVFQLIYSVFYTVQHNELTFSLLDPFWTLWFLLSLVFWNLLLLVFARIKYALVIAVLIGILIGYIPEIGTFLSLQRTFVFFPIFLLGYFLKREHFQLLLTPAKRWAGMITLCILFVGYYFFFPDSGKDWLLSSSSYTDMGVGAGYAGLIRLFIYGLMMTATFSFLAIVPRQKLLFTPIGTRTLYVYLLHGFVIKLLQATPFFDSVSQHHNYLLVVLLSGIVTMTLASRPVVTAAQPIIEMRLSLIRKHFTERHVASN
jgi:fucose 4-O-acetylase-like acetyltransferase